MKYGLTSKEVEQRKEQNLVNTDESVKTKSIKKITPINPRIKLLS